MWLWRGLLVWLLMMFGESLLGFLRGVLLVERIGEIVELSADQIESHHAGKVPDSSELGASPEAELIRGIGKLNGELLLITEAHKLLPCLERVVASRGKATSRQRHATVKEISL